MPFTKKSRVLVINPCVADFKLYDEWMHPAGLYLLLDILSRNNIETYYFDCLADGIRRAKRFGTGEFKSIETEKPDLYRHIKRKYKIYGVSGKELSEALSRFPPPDLIFSGSSMTYWAPGVVDTLRTAADCFPNVPIIIGGIAAQLMPQYFRTQIENSYTAGSLFSADTIRLIQRFIPGFSAVPEERCSLEGALPFLKGIRHGPVLLSLGCPMNCSYCASKILQPCYRERPVETVFREVISFHEKWGVEDFSFFDDALLYRPDKLLIPFLKKIKECGLKFRFHTPNGLHVKFADRKILELMKESNFITLRFGYESGNPRHSGETGNKAQIKKLAEAVSLCKEAGFTKKEIGVYMMGGLRDQSPSELMDEMTQVGELGVKVKPVFLSPVPQTPLFEYYAGLFPRLRDDPLWQNDSFFITNIEGWGWEVLEEIRRRARELNCD